MLAQAVGPNLTKLLHDQLDLMFAAGLSEPLRQALVAIEEHIKPLRRTVQGRYYSIQLSVDAYLIASERLLDTLSWALSGQPYKPLGAPAPLHGDMAKESSINRVGISLVYVTSSLTLFSRPHHLRIPSLLH
jgi:hypothetical protein